MSRSRCGSDSSVAKVSDGDEPFRVRNLQQGVPERAESAAASEGAQPSVEAPAGKQQRTRSSEKGVCVPGEELRAPPPLQSPRRPHGNQETLQPQARGEEVDVPKVFQEIRGSLRLEGPLQDLRH